jgi:hypothetical protein
MMETKSALKFDTEVLKDGRVEVHVPFPPGAHVTVLVAEESVESFDELIAAASTSLDFWNNALDDEDWNDA